jgi:hypothetical protein
MIRRPKLALEEHMLALGDPRAARDEELDAG